MLKQSLAVFGAAVTLSACSYFSDTDETNAGNGYFEPKSIADQDPYWKRFYELEAEIVNLKSQLQRREDTRQQQGAGEMPQATLQHTPAEFGSGASGNELSVADSFLDRIRKQADDALAVIDSALAAIDEDEAPRQQLAGRGAVQERTQEAGVQQYGVSKHSRRVAVAGSLQRNETGDVVVQNTHSQQRQSAYNFSLVYVFPEPRPWNAMWERLEEANEQDKWRGYNPDRLSYFIYVGAYLYERDAVKRQNALDLAMGESPEIRANAQPTSLAAN